MRLLRLEENDELSLVEYVGGRVPPYAILSHTWGPDNEEVTFKDLADGSGEAKNGYRKLTFCREQAAKDGLRFFWVDTCCIDKSSSSELAEAINSMFRWYYKAEKCYVYLSDVSFTDFAENNSSFKKSKWFTRGWTLQELVAPSSVEFYSSEGRKLGDKNSLVSDIQATTGVPIRALQGTSLSRFTVEERLGWARYRETKRDEDAAYSLLGLFDVQMPLLYGEGREKAFKRLRKEIQESSADKLAITSDAVAAMALGTHEERGATTYRIPFSLKGVPIGRFTDRTMDTRALEQVLLSQERAITRRLLVVHGLGGAGKTQLAVDFARRHQRNFSCVLWLDGSGESSIKQSLATFASRIPVGQISETSRMHTAGPGGDTDKVVRDVLSWLSIPDNFSWLIVVDNVDRDYRRHKDDVEAYDVEQYLPEADHGSVLITTRLPHLGQLGEQWELKKVNKDQAQAIFNIWHGRTVGHEGDELLRLLDGLPLALAQAAAYINEMGIDCDTYTRLYKQQWSKLMTGHDHTNGPLRNYASGSVTTTWNISFMAIRARSETAANLLLLWAHLDNKGLTFWMIAMIPHGRFNNAAERASAWLGDIARNEVSFLEAIRVLRSYSLVEETEDRVGFATHPVVHQWALHIQDQSQRTHLSLLAAIIIGHAVPLDHEKRQGEMQARLLPHAVRCEQTILEVTDLEVQAWEPRGPQDRENALLAAIVKFGDLYANQAKFEKAKQMYLRALDGYEKTVGSEHPSVFLMAHNLGTLYTRDGKLEEAEQMLVRAIQGYEKTIGAEHSSTLRTINNLGVVYKDLGKLEEAEHMYERALEAKERTLGPEDVSTLQTVANFAILLADVGKTEEAEKMYMRALRGKEKALGVEHSSTLHTCNNLGALYVDLGRSDEATQMYVRALNGYEKALKAGDFSTLRPSLNTMCNLALCYESGGQTEEARILFEKALASFEQLLGDEHPKCQEVKDSLIRISAKNDTTSGSKDEV